MKVPSVHEPDERDAHEADDLPASRAARARELGLLGAHLAANALRAGTRTLLGGADERARAWPEAHQAGAAAVLRSLGRLRGAAAKLGQLLAQRPGTIPPEYVESLLTLADDVPPMSYGLVKTQLLSELGRSPSQLFAAFERRPLAAASLGQVHAATLHDGTPVAVKIQYPAVGESLRVDLSNLELVIPLLESVARRSDLRDAFAEVRERLSEELDYRLEAASCEEFRGLFAGGSIRIPRVYAALSTGKILTLDLVEGKSLERYLAGDPPQEERDRFARQVLQFTWPTVYRHHLVHADPNPGNYLYGADGRLGVVDFGCVKRFTPAFVGHALALLRAASHSGERELDEVLVACGLLQGRSDADARATVRALTRLWTEPGWKPSFDFGDRSYLDELIRLQHLVLRDSSLAMSPDWIFLGRQMVGIAHVLYRLGASGRFSDIFEEFLRAP